MDAIAHFKVWEKQLVKTKDHWAGSDVIDQRVVKVMVMKVSWLREEAKKAGTESREIKVMGVPQHELS